MDEGSDMRPLDEGGIWSVCDCKRGVQTDGRAGASSVKARRISGRGEVVVVAWRNTQQHSPSAWLARDFRRTPLRAFLSALPRSIPKAPRSGSRTPLDVSGAQVVI